MKSIKYLAPVLLIVALVYGCTPSAPADTPATPSDTPTPTVLLTSLPDTPIPTILPATAIEPTTSGSAILRFRLSTTSDWTDLSLDYAKGWHWQELVSASEQATTAVMQDDHLVLDQPIARAENGDSVEMVVDVFFPGDESGQTMIFTINRGHIGFTEVELSRYVGDEWVLVRTLRWDGIVDDAENALSVEIAAAELLGNTPLLAASEPELEVTAVASILGMPEGTDGYPWWNDTIFYEIFVRSFYDSNADGIGDLNGITQKLDHLNDGDPATSTDLGITGIWLMPIYPSPTYHGYNVTDYYDVNPDYGSLDDLKELLEAAHARGIRVILDLALNHTSNQHPWFVNAGNPASPYHDWYVWFDTDPGYSGSWGQQVWFPYNNDYYYSTFSAYSPDLNHTNPEVLAEVQNVIQFWLEDVGVDGFRLDAAKHLIEEGSIQANSDSTHAWWEAFRPYFKEINSQAVTVAEIWDDPYINAEYLQGDELDLSFDFYLASYFVTAVNDGNAGIVNEQIELGCSLVPPQQFSTFLTNHDMDRLMSQVSNDVQKARVAASLLLTAPGVPFLYYGEEIGMEGEGPHELLRRPMQWSAEQFAGFSTVSPWQEVGPGWESNNVADETGDQYSILSHYRALIRARNQHSALRVGEPSLITTGNNGLYSILRVSQGEAVLVLVNLTGGSITDYRLELETSALVEGSYTPLAIMGEGTFASLSASSSGGFSQYVPLPAIRPYATLILQLNLEK